MGQIAMNMVVQQKANQEMAYLNQIAQLEEGIAKAIGHFKGLKAGELSLDDLLVTDNGWEFIEPAPLPAPAVNGSKAKEPATA